MLPVFAGTVSNPFGADRYEVFTMCNYFCKNNDLRGAIYTICNFGRYKSPYL